MIEYQDELKLQSYLDGELPDAEARALTERLARDAEAAALLNELRLTSKALDGFEQEIKLPETREFYWSKIRREIERQEARSSPVTAPVSWAVRLRRFLVPAAGVAVVALLALVVTRDSGGRAGESTVETSLADSGALVYHDFSAGATFVWLSYPADNDISEEDDGAFD